MTASTPRHAESRAATVAVETKLNRRVNLSGSQHETKEKLDLKHVPANANTIKLTEICSHLNRPSYSSASSSSHSLIQMSPCRASRSWYPPNLISPRVSSFPVLYSSTMEVSKHARGYSKALWFPPHSACRDGHVHATHLGAALLRGRGALAVLLLLALALDKAADVDGLLILLITPLLVVLDRGEVLVVSLLGRSYNQLAHHVQ